MFNGNKRKGYVSFMCVLSNACQILLCSFPWSNELMQAASVYDQMLGFVFLHWVDDYKKTGECN